MLQVDQVQFLSLLERPDAALLRKRNHGVVLAGKVAFGLGIEDIQRCPDEHAVTFLQE